MKFQDFAQNFISAAKGAAALPEQVKSIVPVLPDFAAMYSSAEEKVGQVQQQFEEKAEAVKTAAITYAAATLTLQALAAFSTALIAYKIWRKK
jgi:hypothetical protein